MNKLNDWKRQLEQAEEQGLLFDTHTVKEMIEKIESLQNKLDAKIIFINNGREEERYSLQEDNERLVKQWELLKLELSQKEEFYERTDDTNEIHVIHDIQSLMNKLETGEYYK